MVICSIASVQRSKDGKNCIIFGKEIFQQTLRESSKNDARYEYNNWTECCCIVHRDGRMDFNFRRAIIRGLKIGKSQKKSGEIGS